MSTFMENAQHAFLQTDGTMAWPNSLEGDLLKQAYFEIEKSQMMKALKGQAFNHAVSLNEQVQVRINVHGHRILREYDEKLGTNLHKKAQDGNWSSWQLWNLMEIFGPHIGLGEFPPFMEIRVATP